MRRVEYQEGKLGYFHGFMQDYMEYGTGSNPFIGNYPVAVIEEDDGSIVLEYAANVKLLDRPVAWSVKNLNMEDDGGPAFPGQTITNDLTAPKGMSLRDWFAGMALQGLLASEKPDYEYNDLTEPAVFAYKIADSMLKIREK